MAEEKVEKKKFGIIKLIFKWIFIALLGLLLILGITFQAPWKVITLLVIILLACTVLPKPLRKWFWLSAGAVVIALIIWVFLPDRGEWRPYTFAEELAALEAKRAIPDSENAATIYNQLLENYDKDELEPNFTDDDCYDLTLREPWSSQDCPQIAQWLKGQQTIIETLIDASKIEKCRFPINAAPWNLGHSMDRLALMRRWAYLLIRTGNNDTAESRIDAGLEKYITVLQMAKHQYQQPTLIDLLVGIAIEALASRQFNRFIVAGDATEEHLSTIEEAMAQIKYDWSSDLPRILECEKLLLKNTWGIFYEVNLKGKTRLNRNLLASMCEEFDDMEIKLSEVYWLKKLIKAYTILTWFYMPSTPQKVAKVIDTSHEKFYKKMTESDFDWQKGPTKFPITSVFRLKFNYRQTIELMAGMLEGTYYRIHDTYLRVITDKRGSQLIIALRRYKNKTGHWPEKLDDVKPLAPAEIFVDPINNDSFVYKLTKENFTLYSRGKNNIDEGGQYNSKWDPDSFVQRIEEDDRLIWPPKSCKTKEQNADAEQQ